MLADVVLAGSVHTWGGIVTLTALVCPNVDVLSLRGTTLDSSTIPGFKTA